MGRFDSEDPKKKSELTDQFWSIILDKQDSISAENISQVFRTLPHLKQSREIIQKLLEHKLNEHWRELDSRAILEILGVLTSMKLAPIQMMRVISQWATVNLHTLTEGELLAIIYCFHK